MLLHHVDGAPVSDILNGQLGHGRERLLVVERGRQRDADVGQKASFLFDPLSLGDVLRDAEQVQRVAGWIEDRNLFRVQEANAVMARLDRFFGDIDHVADLHGLPIFLDEELGLFPWPKIEVVLTDQRLPRPSEQVFSCAIEPHEPQRRALLDEQHERNVFDDGVEECVGIPELLVDALALADVLDTEMQYRGSPARSRSIDALSMMSTIVPSLRM